MGRAYSEQRDDVTLTCGAGEILDAVVADTVARNYWGLENLSAIPGTVGATPIQNVGAYGVEVSSLVTAVRAVHVDTLEEKVFSTAACQFGYRDSFFKTSEGRAWVVVEVTVLLSKAPAPQLTYGALAELQSQTNLSSSQVREKVVSIRAGKFPDWHIVGTAGSFFKNPIISRAQYEQLCEKYPELPGYPTPVGEVKVSLGWILDHVCHLRGYCQDGVCLYEQQALVLVNVAAKNANAIDVFADHIANRVADKTGISIEREVRKV